MTRRVHNSIDLLPEALQDTLLAMVVDGDWPDDWPADLGETKGKPIYEDVVAYSAFRGHRLSLSAVGRWAQPLQGSEQQQRMVATARKLCRSMTAETASENQKAAAELITAQIIDLSTRTQLTPKQTMEVATAIKSCTTVAMQADQYIRKQLAEKARAAADSTRTKLEGEGIDRAKIQSIIDEILGVVKS